METYNSISTFEAPTPDALAAHWGPNAPRGARAVLTRIVKEGANVPLFLGQTLVNALRDLGYNDTTSAICEHVDNAVQWGANEVRIYFNELGRKNEKKIDVLVYDNGVGMAPNVLRAVTAFGGSLCFENREGIGRYGMGMKAAALSISPRLEIYSWQERGAVYNMDLDVRDLASDKGNVVYLPEPALDEKLPADVRDILTSQMSHPRTSHEAQILLAEEPEELTERLGKSGTIIYMPAADRLTTRQVKRLVDSATRQMARIYRRHIASGLRLFINNRPVDPVDPTYFMPEARHTKVEGIHEKRSRIINSWAIEVGEDEESQTTHRVTARLFLLPIEDWNDQPRKVLKNDLHVFDNGVSFMRSNREVQYGPLSALTGRTSRDSWWRLEIEFPPELDEAFGVAVNKQGVRPKGYVVDKIRKAIADDLASTRSRIEQFQSERAVEQKKGKQSAAEQRANEVESLQSLPLAQPATTTEDEQRELEARLRELAVAYKRPDETDDEAVERVRGSRFIIATRHDEGPFYAAEARLGKVVLTINTGHAFFEHVYKPLAELAKLSEGGGGEDGVNLEADLVASCSQLVVKLQLTLLALARTQSQMAATDPEHRKLFDQLRKNWSHSLDTMLISG
jgi:hypothetical protein